MGAIERTGFENKRMVRGRKSKLSQKGRGQQQQKVVAHCPRNEMKLLSSGFGDNEPTRNTKELHIKVWDWLTWEIPTAVPPGSTPVTTYGMDLTQNFFGGVFSQGSINLTKNRVRSVTLEVLTPASAIDSGGGALGGPVSLFQIVAAVPVTQAGSSGSSLVGQSTTVVHPDVRRPWVRVGKWNFMEIFDNTQFEPCYYSAQPGVVELFRFSVIDAATGNQLLFSAGETGIAFRLSVEISAPVALVPNPVRWEGVQTDFAGGNLLPTLAQATSPAQYEILRIANIL